MGRRRESHEEGVKGLAPVTLCLSLFSIHCYYTTTTSSNNFFFFIKTSTSS
jgi:hypothetical protein